MEEAEQQNQMIPHLSSSDEEIPPLEKVSIDELFNEYNSIPGNQTSPFE